MKVTVYVKENNLNSGNISLRQSHIDAFVGNLISKLEVRCKETDAKIAEYYGIKLSQIIGSAIARGKMKAGYGTYYLATLPTLPTLSTTK